MATENAVIYNVPAGSALGYTLLAGGVVLGKRRTDGIQPTDGGAAGGTYSATVDLSTGATAITWDTGGASPQTATYSLVPAAASRNTSSSPYNGFGPALIVGQPAALNAASTQARPFVASEPQVVIYAPDATAQAPSAPPVTTMSADGLTVTFTSAFLPTLGGMYRFRYSYNDAAAGGGETMNAAQQQFAFWTDVPSLVRELLQMNTKRMPDPVIQREFALMLSFLLARFGDPVKYPHLQSYYGLLPADQSFFDNACGYMTAVQLYPEKFRGASGLIDQVKVGNFQFNYAAGGEDPRSTWTQQAALALGYVSDIRAYRLRQAQSWNPNCATGPSRRQVGSGLAQGILNTVLNAYQDKTDQTLL